jgi:hypothetical protein
MLHCPPKFLLCSSKPVGVRSRENIRICADLADIPRTPPVGTYMLLPRLSIWLTLFQNSDWNADHLKFHLYLIAD